MKLSYTESDPNRPKKQILDELEAVAKQKGNLEERVRQYEAALPGYEAGLAGNMDLAIAGFQREWEELEARARKLKAELGMNE